MKLKRWTTALAAAALASVIAGTVTAQGPMMGERGGQGMWNEDGMGWGMWGGPFGRWGGRGGSDWMLERMEGRLSFLKTELKITDAQTQAWTEFTQAVRNAAKQRNERMRTVFSRQEKTATLPERVEAQEQFMAAHLEEVRQIKTSLKNLYAVLSDEQKKEADEMAIPMVGMGMGGPGWHHM